MIAVIASVIASFFVSCNENGGEEQLSHAYTGVLSLEYTKGFPAYSCTTSLELDIQKDRSMTFTGGGDTRDFEAEDILYEDGKPVTKIRIDGTLVFNGAQGEVRDINNEECAMIRVSSSLYVQMTVWAWDDELGWIQMLDLPHTQQDNYSDGEMQFTLLNASSANGQDIKSTLPDIQGTFTYGYNLTLIVAP